MKTLHKKSTLMSWTKEELANYIIMLEQNLVTLSGSFDIQYQNMLKLLDDMKIVNETYEEMKK